MQRRSRRRDPGPGSPVVGACRVLTAADIEPSSNNTPTVPCSSPHTSVTIAVESFPAAQITNKNLSSGALGNQALQRCTAAWKRTVGGNRTSQHTALLGLAYYLPNQVQLSKGARWFRCDLVLGGQDGLPLQNLPAKVDGLLDPPVPESVQACRTTPDFTTGHAVPCDQHHVLKAIGTAPLPGGTTFPGQAALACGERQGVHPGDHQMAPWSSQRRRRLPVARPDRVERPSRPHGHLLDRLHRLTAPRC